MKTNALKLLLLAGVMSIMAGCKVAVIVVEGGEVQSVLSGTCFAGTVCIHEVPDSSFAESFTAVPDSGWSFVKWNNGGDFLCEDQTDPTCEVSNVGTAGLPPIEAIIASDKAYYIQPIFVEVGLPVNFVAAVDGNDWAELTQFAGVTYEEIAAVCSGGMCSGILNGYNMNGLNWATNAQVHALLNIYSLGACPGVPCETPMITNAVGAALTDGFQITGIWLGIVEIIDGYTSNPKASAYAGIGRQSDIHAMCVGVSDVNSCNGSGAVQTSGGWFFK